MIISHKYKFIFIKTVKTAGASIKVFLSQHCADTDVVTPIFPHIEPHVARNYSGRWNPVGEILLGRGMGRYRGAREWIEGRRFYNHIPGVLIQQRVPADIWASYFKFCVERNPFDKTLSHYHMLNNRSGGALSFDQYMRDGRFCINYPKYTDANRDLIVDAVVRYESMQEGLGSVFARLGIPFDGSLGVKAKEDYRKDRTPYRDVIGAEHRNVLEEVFATELALHGYAF